MWNETQYTHTQTHAPSHTDIWAWILVLVLVLTSYQLAKDVKWTTLYNFLSRLTYFESYLGMRAIDWPVNRTFLLFLFLFFPFFWFHRALMWRTVWNDMCRIAYCCFYLWCETIFNHISPSQIDSPSISAVSAEFRIVKWCLKSNIYLFEKKDFGFIWFVRSRAHWAKCHGPSETECERNRRKRQIVNRIGGVSPSCVYWFAFVLGFLVCTQTETATTIKEGKKHTHTHHNTKKKNFFTVKPIINGTTDRRDPPELWSALAQLSYIDQTNSMLID